MQMNVKELIRQLLWLLPGASGTHLSEDWKENKYHRESWEKKDKIEPQITPMCITSLAY